jgi:ketosteroid isomerase-like protein
VSLEHVERVKSGFAAHNRGDLDFLVELYHPEAVFETLLLGIHHGNEAIRVIYASRPSATATKPSRRFPRPCLSP